MILSQFYFHLHCFVIGGIHHINQHLPAGGGWGGLYLAAQKILLGFHGISMFDFQVISQFYSELWHNLP